MGDPHLKPFLLKLDNFRKQLHLNDIFPTAKRGFEGLTDFGSKLQEKKLNPIPIFRNYFDSVGKFLNINTGGLFPANLFLDRLPQSVIKCTIEDSTKPLQSSALSSLEALTSKLYPGSPPLADPGFYKYIEPLSGGRLRSSAICQKMMEDISRAIYIATHGVPKANDYTTLSQLTGLSITELKNSATNIDVMSKLRQLKDMVGTKEFPEVLKKVCDTTYGLFVLDLIDLEGSTVGNSALSLLNGLTSLAAHVCLTPVRAIMPRPGFLNPSFPPDVTADLEKNAIR